MLAEGRSSLYRMLAVQSQEWLSIFLPGRSAAFLRGVRERVRRDRLVFHNGKEDCQKGSQYIACLFFSYGGYNWESRELGSAERPRLEHDSPELKIYIAVIVFFLEHKRILK